MAGTQEPANVALEPSAGRHDAAGRHPDPPPVTVDRAPNRLPRPQRRPPVVARRRRVRPLAVAAHGGRRTGSAGEGSQPCTRPGRRLTSARPGPPASVASDLLLVPGAPDRRDSDRRRAGYGRDELAPATAGSGSASFDLMVARVLLISLGYAATTPAGLWGTSVDFVLNYPGCCSRSPARSPCCAVVVTSMRAAGAGCARWSPLIPLYAYLGVGLALPPSCGRGKNF